MAPEPRILQWRPACALCVSALAAGILAGFAAGRAWRPAGGDAPAADAGRARAESPPSAGAPPPGPPAPAADSPHEATAAPAGGRAPAGQAAPPRPIPPAFLLDAAKPLRIVWPLDVGPGPGGRDCLRARQGVNEIQERGGGRALYAFRVERPGPWRTALRVLWGDDGIGSVDCNNSLFASIDDSAPATVGNEDERRGWHWEAGPRAELAAGVHWLCVELREDGVFCDRVAVLGPTQRYGTEELDALPVETFGGLEGHRPPTEPDAAVRDVEIAALPTRSVVIGRGHVNEVTVLASYQRPAGTFRGRIAVDAPTAPGVRATGDLALASAAPEPFARAGLTLEFPAAAARRTHSVRVRVLSERADGAPECVFQTRLPFVKPPAWAFVGPYRDASGGRSGTAGPHDDQLPALLDALAARAAPEVVARLGGAPGGAVGPTGIGWKVVDDGSCYDELGAIDMYEVFGRVRNASAYAVTWIRAETSLRHRSFSFQADDTGTLWIGGQLVAAMPVVLPKECNRLWSSARLEEGINPVVVKLAQGSGYWGFRFDVVEWHWQGRRGDTIYGAEPGDWPGAGGAR